MEQVLTPSERIQYLNTGILPSRVYFSNENHAYMLKGNKEHKSNDLTRHRGNNRSQNQQYKVMPRWKYLLSNILPDGNMFNTGDFPEIGLGDSDDKDSTNDKNNNAGSKDDIKDDVKDDDNTGSKDDKKDDVKDDDNTGGKDDKKDDKKDDNKDEFINNMRNNTPMELIGDALRGDTAELVKDAIMSDTGQEVIKMGISLLPGGGAILQAYEAGKKLNDATGFTGKITNKFM